MGFNQSSEVRSLFFCFSLFVFFFNAVFLRLLGVAFLILVFSAARFQRGHRSPAAVHASVMPLC